MGAIDSIISTVGSALGGSLINSLNQSSAVKMLDRINEYNQPKNQFKRLAEAGINPATAISKGDITNVSAEQQAPDVGGAFSAAASTMNNALQASLLDSQRKNIDADTKTKEAEAAKTEAETEGIFTDNEFKALLHQGELNLMSAEEQERLKNAELSEQQIVNLKREYEKLGKQMDEIDAHILEMKANANKMDKEAALAELEKELRRSFVNSEIAKNDATIKMLAKEAYYMAMQGDAAAVDAANKRVQGEILSVQRKYADTIESNKAFVAGHQTAQAESATRLANEKVRAQVLANKREGAGTFLYDIPLVGDALGATREWFGCVGQVFGGTASIPVKPQ